MKTPVKALYRAQYDTSFDGTRVPPCRETLTVCACFLVVEAGKKRVKERERERERERKRERERV